MLKNEGKLLGKLAAWEQLILALWLSNQSKSLKFLRNWLPSSYRGANVYSLVSRLATTGVIAQTGEGYYRLTALGIGDIEKKFPLLVTLKEKPEDKFDGHFLTCILDAPDRQPPSYRMFTQKLLRWRFGHLTRGMYLSPHRELAPALEHAITKYRLSGVVRIGWFFPEADLKGLADQVWDTTDQNHGWRMLLDRLSEWRRAQAGVPKEKSDRTVRIIHQDFLNLLTREPFLPPELLPHDYWRAEAVKRILEN